MSEEHLLIVDDEEYIRELLGFNLKKEGYIISTAASGEEALKSVMSNPPDLIILDLMLPGVDGIEVCQRLKKDPKTRKIPVIMITAKSEDTDVILGLEIGADDYITKPFSPKIITARVRAVLRRKVNPAEDENRGEKFNIHDITIDFARHEVTCGNEPVDLSVTEFSILEFLSRNAGWVFSRSQIIGAVKGDDYPVTERAVDVQILGLRKKLGARGNYIETVRGVGYRMRESVEQAG